MIWGDVFRQKVVLALSSLGGFTWQSRSFEIMRSSFVWDPEDKGISSRILKGSWDGYFSQSMSHYFVRSCNNVNYYVEQYVGGERKVFMERWHCIVCLCEWCGWNNHKVLLSNYHICQSIAIGCVGGREILCGANCVITMSWESYSQAQVLLCVLKYLEDNPTGTLSSVLSWLTVHDTCGEWCVLELLELQNLLRKLVFLWVSNLGSSLHLQKCFFSK